ncbi:isochorismatase family protein [Domibacillus epiphyticus]|uniref:Carbamoylsarcosine amidase n=1 Tax=Domibacillus epiphyticus TaxID=1714355 RepID=A0A1V2A889_9BACI|nr:isochorismatase family protein [Domibacillus epiphyticus]OMP67225.1 carbamoylsarcosine amidase [Domibacillus epiphyticus]
MNDTEEKIFFEKRGFGKNIGFGERPAILVVDFINAFTNYQNPEMVLSSNLEKQIYETNRLLDASRPLGIPVIYTTISYDDDLLDAGIWVLKQSGLETLRAETEAVKIDCSLHSQDNDSVMTKKYASSFFGTDLSSRLTSQQIDTLIITGCTTSGCVRASAVDAVSYGFRPIIVEEAVGDRSVAAHNQSLFDIQAKYGDVVSVETVLSYFERIKS